MGSWVCGALDAETGTEDPCRVNPAAVYGPCGSNQALLIASGTQWLCPPQSSISAVIGDCSGAELLFGHGEGWGRDLKSSAQLWGGWRCLLQHTGGLCVLVSGMLTAVLLYQGNIPRLFQKNLLYCQKSKYRIPKARVVAHVEGDEQRRKRKNGKSISEPRA